MTDLDERIAFLKRKLAARKGRHEYRDNVPVIEQEIARLEAAKSHAMASGSPVGEQKDQNDG